MFPAVLRSQIESNPFGMLVFDLVTGARAVPDILKRYDMTEAQLAARLKDPGFKQIYREVKKAWASDMNVHERLRFKAALLAEESLPVIFEILHNDRSGDQTKLEAFKQLRDVGAPKDKDGGGRNFSLTIVASGVPEVKVDGRQVIEGEVLPKLESDGAGKKA